MYFLQSQCIMKTKLYSRKEQDFSKPYFVKYLPPSPFIWIIPVHHPHLPFFRIQGFESSGLCPNEHWSDNGPDQTGQPRSGPRLLTGGPSIWPHLVRGLRATMWLAQTGEQLLQKCIFFLRSFPGEADQDAPSAVWMAGGMIHKYHPHPLEATHCLDGRFWFRALQGQSMCLLHLGVLLFRLLPSWPI